MKIKWDVLCFLDFSPEFQNKSQVEMHHALIIFERARVCVGGGGRHVTHSSHNSAYALMFYLFLLIFILNIPKRINYIMKYLDSHLYRLLVDL